MNDRFLSNRILFESVEDVDEFLLIHNEDITKSSWNFMFFNPFVKSYCFDELSSRFGYEIINVDTTLTRFCTMISNSGDNVVFDGMCNNISSDIMNILENNKGIFVSSTI